MILTRRERRKISKKRKKKANINLLPKESKCLKVGIVIGTVVTSIACAGLHALCGQFSPKTVTIGTEELSAIMEESEVTIVKLSNTLYSHAQEEPQAEEAKVVEVLIAEHTIDAPNTRGSESYENRNHNLAVAAATINGTIIAPNEDFDWFEIIGDTTEEKGYKPAGMYKNGQLVNEDGGGVCQLATTINSAIQKIPGFKTDEDYLGVFKHSKPSSYIKPERGDKEATVAYSAGKNFWFKNSLEYPMRVNVETEADAVTVRVYLIISL